MAIVLGDSGNKRSVGRERLREAVAGAPTQPALSGDPADFGEPPRQGEPGRVAFVVSLMNQP